MNLNRRIASLEQRWPGRSSLAELHRKAMCIGLEQLTDTELEMLIAEGEAAAGRTCPLPLNDTDLGRIIAGDPGTHC